MGRSYVQVDQAAQTKFVICSCWHSCQRRQMARMTKRLRARWASLRVLP